MKNILFTSEGNDSYKKVLKKEFENKLASVQNNSNLNDDEKTKLISRIKEQYRIKIKYAEFCNF